MVGFFVAKPPFAEQPSCSTVDAHTRAAAASVPATPYPIRAGGPDLRYQMVPVLRDTVTRCDRAELGLRLRVQAGGPSEAASRRECAGVYGV
jgi:hypothetical protein